MTQSQIEYVVRRLLNIACPAISANFTVNGCEAIFNDKKIMFSLCSEEENRALIDGLYKMNSIRSVDGQNNVPIMLKNDTPFAETHENILFVYADILTLSFYLLSRMEETFQADRDEFGRFSYYSSLSYKYSFVHLPIVDEYALLLRVYIKELLPNIDLGNNKGHIIPTHDIDSIRRFEGVYPSLKSLLAGDLLIRKSPKLFIKSLRQYLKCANDPLNDPELLGAIILLELSMVQGLKAEFYFMGYEKSEKDYRYNASSPTIRNLMKIIKKKGMTVGFHGGIGSCDNVDVFSMHKKNVEKANNDTVEDGRQHYLCFDAKTSPVVWQVCGMKRDLTLGFYDHEGFRCGTCHSYPLYDLGKDCELDVIEQPLIVMDATLKEYRKLSINQAQAIVHKLYKKCLSVEGNFVILWHNSSVFREWEEWFNKVYVNLIEASSKNANNEL